jgi:hypothetical protein
VLQGASRPVSGIATTPISLELVAVGVLDNALLTLLPARTNARLGLLRKPDLILLRILWLSLGGRLRRLRLSGILRQEPRNREKDQKKKRIHVASKTLAMMHEPESLHYLHAVGR